MTIIDHYSKLAGSDLIRNKTAKEALLNIDNFINIYMIPTILQCDHGKEFDSKFLKDYSQEKNINLIYSRVRHPTTNRVVEAVHKDIVNTLKVEKITKKDSYDLTFFITNPSNEHNNSVHSLTK